MFDFQPLDIVVFKIVTNTLADRIERWGLGNPYGHVGIYLGGRFHDFYESAARGVLITAFDYQYGKTCVVMRLRPEFLDDKATQLVAMAHQIAGEYDAYYGWGDILWFVIPKILLDKVHLPYPLKYHRDKHMICSEAVAEVFWRCGLNILPQDQEPMPADFVSCNKLIKFWEGKIEL